MFQALFHKVFETVSMVHVFFVRKEPFKSIVTATEQMAT